MQVSLILQWFRNVLVENSLEGCLLYTCKVGGGERSQGDDERLGAPGHPIKPREAKYLLYILPASQPSVRLRNLPARRQGTSRPVPS
jgi:hypothetical protein